MRGAALFAIVSLLFTTGASRSALLADEPSSHSIIAEEIQPIVRSVEKAIRGKADRPLEEFVAEDATFQGRRPLRKSLQPSGDKAKPFPAESKVFWTDLSKLKPRDRSVALVPEEVDPERTVLVYRDLNAEEGRRFRLLYWLSKVEDRWMLVYGADGWMPTEPLASISKELFERESD